jgi:hypothetical protein
MGDVSLMAIYIATKAFNVNENSHHAEYGSDFSREIPVIVAKARACGRVTQADRRPVPESGRF